MFPKPSSKFRQIQKSNWNDSSPSHFNLGNSTAEQLWLGMQNTQQARAHLILDSDLNNLQDSNSYARNMDATENKEQSEDSSVIITVTNIRPSVGGSADISKEVQQISVIDLITPTINGSNQNFSSINRVESSLPQPISYVEVIANRWALGPEIGTGGFGKVYDATDLRGMTSVAVKVGDAGTSSDSLKNEAYIYQQLLQSANATAVPNVYFQGMTKIGQKTCEVMVMEKLGISLQQVMAERTRFEAGSIFRVALQLLDRLEQLHSIGFVHRDIKTTNVLVGRQDTSILYLIDLGLAERFHSSGTPLQEQGFVGTPLSASIAGNRGMEQSPKDDLESLGYMLILLMQGRLPWSHIQGESLPRLNQIVADCKQQIELHVLCRAMPPEVSAYFMEIRVLKFGQMPDYDILKGIFINGILRLKEPLEEIFYCE